MKKVLFLTALLVGCAAKTTTYPVELPDGLSGTYVQCRGDLDCAAKCVGVCQNGYWIAEYISSKNLDHNGIVIVCGKSPSQL